MVHRFCASRLSAGNRLFPTVIEVNDRHVTLKKPSFSGLTEESISLRQISSVKIRRGRVWADVIVQSSGGTDPLCSSGHPLADAERLKAVIEQYQTNILATGMADTSGLRACPRCAELVKAAALVCRFCGGPIPIELTEEAGPADDPPTKEWSWS